MSPGSPALTRTIFALPILFLGCCAASPPPIAGVTADCPVCKHEGDLACVCVRIEPDTPRCECGGETYYFCSVECRDDFAADPEEFLERK